VVEEGVGKARSIVDSRVGDGNGSGPDDTSGTAPPTDTGSTYPPGPTAGTGGYSSSR
jgi:hypothetical protein